MMRFWESQSSDIIDRLTLELNAKRAKQRSGLCERLEECYFGNGLQYVKNYIREQVSDPGVLEEILRSASFQNILKSIVNPRSKVYTSYPTYKVVNKETGEEDETATKAFLSITKDWKKAAPYLNKMAILTGGTVLVGIKPAPRGEYGVRHLIITQRNCEIAQLREYPDTAAVIKFQKSSSEQSAYGHKPGEIRYSVFTQKEHFLVDEYGKKYPPSEDNQEMVNPWGDILTDGAFGPFCKLSLGYADDFWGPLDLDLYEDVMELSWMATQFNHAFKFQSFSVPVGIGFDENETITIDPCKPLYLTAPSQIGEGGQDFRFEKPQLDLMMLAQAIQFKTIEMCKNYGIPPSKVKWEGYPSSGIALRLENYEILEERAEMIPSFEAMEQDRFKIVRAMNNELFGQTKPEGWALIPYDTELRVDFEEPQFPISEAEMLENYQKRVDMGISSQADVLRELNPDIKSIDDAQAMIREIELRKKEVNDIQTKYGTKASSRIDALLGTGGNNAG